MALLVFGIIFFLLLIFGLVLNTTFLIREIRRNEQHDAFVNAVTHELKTPLASIRLYLETLDEEQRREFYKHHVGRQRSTVAHSRTGTAGRPHRTQTSSARV